MTTTDPADVIVNVPPALHGCQVAVLHRPGYIDVQYRTDPRGQWNSINFCGGSVEIRPQTVEVLPCQEDVGRTDEVRTSAPITVIHGGAA